MVSNEEKNITKMMYIDIKTPCKRIIRAHFGKTCFVPASI